MILIDDARHVWHRLWSVRLGILSAVVEGANVFASSWFQVAPSTKLAAVAGLLALAASLSRIIKQPKLHKDTDG